VILPDVNVLIYAFRPEAPQHAEYEDWLQSVVTGVAVYGMAPSVLSSVIRISTNRRAFGEPDSVEKVLAFANALLSQPNCQIVQPGPRHWQIFCDLCRNANATANLVPDAWFASLAIESGCEWITNDRGFARFPGLRWRTPF
jgi:uncharacterized protein